MYISLHTCTVQPWGRHPYNGWDRGWLAALPTLLYYFFLTIYKFLACSITCLYVWNLCSYVIISEHKCCLYINSFYLFKIILFIYLLLLLLFKKKNIIPKNVYDLSHLSCKHRVMLYLQFQLLAIWFDIPRSIDL